jgi:hypothetical protein
VVSIVTPRLPEADEANMKAVSTPSAVVHRVAAVVMFASCRVVKVGPSSRKEANQMKSKKWLIVPVTAAMLAVGAIGSMSALAETLPPATPPAASPPAAPEAPEAAEPASTTPELAEPNEPALPGGGHADADGTNVDNQFDGVQ